MAAHAKPLVYAAQSIVAGLAIAFVAVLIRPELANLHRGPPDHAAAAAPSSYADAVAASSPAVVNIYTERPVLVDRYGRTVRAGGLGSGVVVSPAGYVITNWHVIDGADQVRVQLADGRVATPILVGTDHETELALLRVDLDDLPAIELGRSDALAVGDVVLAIGNSLGLSHTVTMGIVSATGREGLGVTEFEDFIQTDAAINVGNSGGALVNARGELVGINTAVSERASRSPPEGIGFAIPVNLVRGVLTDLLEHGRVMRGYLGVETRSIPPELARTYGLDGWAVVVDAARGPAWSAGIRPGDVLTHIDGEAVRDLPHARALVAGTRPGDTISIHGIRASGEQYETEAVLQLRRCSPAAETADDRLDAAPLTLDCVTEEAAEGSSS